jgi:hypothetical protein
MVILVGISNFSALAMVLERVGRGGSIDIGDQITILELVKLFKENNIVYMTDLEEVFKNGEN